MSKHAQNDLFPRDSFNIINNSSTAHIESLDFEELESVMWRKHQLRRFFQDRGYWWTSSRRTTARKWTLVILLGLLIGLIGFFVSFLTNVLFDWKFHKCDQLAEDQYWSAAFFLYLTYNLFFAVIAGCLCYYEPTAAGSGIPEIKAYLNGINLNTYVRIKTLIVKVLGMCFSVASGLPLGKEGPMIHSGAIIGAAVSQGKTLTFGFDTSWTKFQDLRNDKSKRDFITFGAAAGVAAAFNAPIGGILFTLEEGASYWSTSLTFRSFFCAMITQLTLNLLYSGFKLGTDRGDGLFAFGLFDDFGGYATYELIIFVLIGIGGGLLGALFNEISRRASIFRKQYINTTQKRFIELIVITTVMSIISFVLPLLWNKCTKKPTDTADWTSAQVDLLDKLSQFQCSNHEYNEVASLYFVPADIAMQQLFHYREVDGTSYTSFSTGALLLFFFPYFMMASIISGVLAPAGLFVPTLLAGASLGRIVGHILNTLTPGYVTDSGTYALIGASALMGGMSRMTIAGTVIILEASGNSQYLLPLMLTFAAARYSGNAINEPMYDIMIHLQELPFLDGGLKTLGLLNYHPIVEIMAHPVVTLNEINKVSDVHKMLSLKSHNGFPVISKDGHLRGLILRKQLCTLLKLKAFSAPIELPATNTNASTRNNSKSVTNSNVAITPTNLQLAPAATVFHDTMERGYPSYPKIGDIVLSHTDMECWLDIRPYMDTSPYAINVSASIQRCYRLFRTMGLRHLAVLDGDHRVIGIITRKDITERRLEHHWYHEGDNMQKFINVDPMVPGVVHESDSLLFSAPTERDDFDASQYQLNTSTHTNTSNNTSSHGGQFSGLNPISSKQQQQNTTTRYQPPNSNNIVSGGAGSSMMSNDNSMNPMQPSSNHGFPTTSTTTAAASITPSTNVGIPSNTSNLTLTPTASSVDKTKKAMKEPKSIR